MPKESLVDQGVIFEEIPAEPQFVEEQFPCLDNEPPVDSLFVEMPDGQYVYVGDTDCRPKKAETLHLPNGQQIHFETPTKTFLIMKAMKNGINRSEIISRFYEGDIKDKQRASSLIARIYFDYLYQTDCYINNITLPDDDVHYQILEDTGQNECEEQNPYLVKIKEDSKKEHPTEEKIPDLYLLALNKLFDSTCSPKDASTMLDLYHRNQDARRFSRITLQTTLNHLAVRAANGQMTHAQEDIWMRLSDKYQTSEALDIVDRAKEDVRNSYPFPYEEADMPDNSLGETEECSIRKNFMPQEMVALARLMQKQADAPLNPDKSLPKLIPPYVLDKSCTILDSFSHLGSNMKTPAQLRRNALEVVMDNFSDIQAALDFLESNPVPIKSLFHWLEVNRNYAIKLYLKQVEEDQTYVPNFGDVTTRVSGAVLNDDEATSLIEYAGRVERRKMQVVVKNLLGNSKIPEEQVYALLESDAVARKVLGKQEKNGEVEEFPTEAGIKKVAPINIEDGAKKQQIKEVEARIGNLRSEIRNLIAAHLTIGLVEYTLGDIENQLGLDRRQVYNLQEKGFVKPNKSNGKRGDDHPLFTPEQFISLKALQKNQRNLTPALVKQLHDIVSDELENAVVSSGK